MFANRGFSLFELLITLTIIGILAALALPAYTQHLAHEHRIEAEIALEKLAVGLEQYYTLNNTYQNASLGALGIDEQVAGGTYTVGIDSATDSHFVVEAMPSYSQAQKDAQCGVLTLNSAGEKGITGMGDLNNCW